MHSKGFKLHELLLGHLRSHNGIGSFKHETSLVDLILTQLLDKLADQKLLKQSEALFLQMLEVEQFDFGHNVGFMFKPSSYLSRKMQNSHKHVVPRLKIT